MCKSRKRQDQEEVISMIPWLGKKCPACEKGFNRTVRTEQCHACDSFTHKKTSCGGVSSDSTFYCKKCRNYQPNPTEGRKEGSVSLSCEHCKYESKSKYNLERHISRKYQTGQEQINSSDLEPSPKET